MDIENRLEQYAGGVIPGEALKAKTVMRMKAADPAGRKIGLRRLARIALIAALILSLAVIGYATGLLSPETEDQFAEVLGETDEQRALIEELGMPLDISVTAGGITVTAEAALNDGKALAVLYKVERDNGEPLLPADTKDLKGVLFTSKGQTQTDSDFSLGLRRKGVHIDYMNYIPGDTVGYYIDYVSAVRNPAERYEMELGQLQAWYDRKRNGVERLTDHGIWWEFDFTVPQTTESLIFAEGTVFEKNGEEFRIDFIHVSPLAILVDYTVLSDTPSHRAEHVYETNPNGSVTHAINFHEEAFTDNINLVLRLKDGQEIDLSTVTDLNGITNPMGYVENTYTHDIQSDNDDEVFIVHRRAVLPEIIPYDQMDCVIFNDVEYKIP